jgi:hypothetical protein
MRPRKENNHHEKYGQTPEYKVIKRATKLPEKHDELIIYGFHKVGSHFAAFYCIRYLHRPENSDDH